jgi:hypothetical protein
MKYSLLITSCIQPNFANMNPNFRSDSNLRLSDYSNAFRYWLSYKEAKITHIIFVENSGYDLAELKKIAANENVYDRIIEFIQFKAITIPEGLHYGYSELEILDKAFDLSKSISETDSFIKVTGRLYFPNLSKLLKRIPNSRDVTIDFRDYKFFEIKKQYALTTLIVIKNDFYSRKLYGIKSSMNKERLSLFETLYYEVLEELSLSNRNIVTRFPINVDPVGIGAHWNSNYNSLLKKAFNYTRGLLRVVYPSLKV